MGIVGCALRLPERIAISVAGLVQWKWGWIGRSHRATCYAQEQERQAIGAMCDRLLELGRHYGDLSCLQSFPDLNCYNQLTTIPPRYDAERSDKSIAQLHLTANAIAVAIEAVWITADNPEVPMRNITTVQVRGRWHDANVWIGRVAVRSRLGRLNVYDEKDRSDNHES